MNYEIILKFSYTVEDVDSEEEAYEEAIKIMKQDTHPMPYDWASYRLSSDNSPIEIFQQMCYNNITVKGDDQTSERI